MCARFPRILPVLMAIGSVALSSRPALSETVFEATLDGLSNVPPVPAVSATGEAVMVLNDAQTELSYTITFTVLSSTEIGAHFHNAGPRANGGILAGLPLGTPKVGVWPVTPADVLELFAGRVYINVHTNMYTGGEIRGNVAEADVPIQDTTWGRVKALYRAESR